MNRTQTAPAQSGANIHVADARALLRDSGAILQTAGAILAAQTVRIPDPDLGSTTKRVLHELGETAKRFRRANDLHAVLRTLAIQYTVSGDVAFLHDTYRMLNYCGEYSSIVALADQMLATAKPFSAETAQARLYRFIGETAGAPFAPLFADA